LSKRRRRKKKKEKKRDKPKHLINKEKFQVSIYLNKSLHISQNSWKIRRICKITTKLKSKDALIKI
jgi:hypothetical protein